MLELEPEVREVWGRMSRAFEKLPPDEEELGPPMVWARCASLLEGVFTSFLGRALVIDRFSAPPAYAAFMTFIGGGWWHEGDAADEITLYDSARVIELTRTNCSLHAEDRLPDTGLWINIGEPRSQRHEFLLCCDKRHPMFGAVADAEDTHPWMGLQGLRVLAPSFLEYLRGLARH